MIFRVSFYYEDEVADGRARRYMVDVQEDSIDIAKEKLLLRLGKEEPGRSVVIRSAYKAPSKAIRPEPSFVFVDADSRNKWYSSHKTAAKERLCHECNAEPVEHYKRIGKKCREKRDADSMKPCIACPTLIPTASRKRYCPACSAKRKDSQEKNHREKRAKLNTRDRINTQVEWAKEALKTTTLLSCKLASRFQGLRVPNLTNEDTRCRTCLQKFIDVQSLYLSNLMVEEQDAQAILASFNQMLNEGTHVHSHAAGA